MLVQVIVHVPAAIPVTKPVLALTVAIAVLLEVQTFVPAVPLANKVVLFTHTDVVPVLLCTTGNGLTVMSFVTAKVHELESVSV